MDNQEIIKQIKYSIYSWVDLKENSRILCLNIETDIIETLKSKKHIVVDYENVNYGIKFDYILCNFIIEKNKNPKPIFDSLFSLLKNDGTMYLVTDNKFGLRYACGDIVDDSLYLYTKSEVIDLLKTTNFIINKKYSVLPSFDAAQLIYDESYLPNESLSVRYLPIYKNPDMVFKREELLHDYLSKDDDFHNYVNNYLFVCSKKIINDDLLGVTMSPDRGIENACITKIYKNKVTKEYTFNKKKIFDLLNNSDYLGKHGVSMVEYKIDKKRMIMPYIKADSLVKVLQDSILNDFDSFLMIMDSYRDLVYNSSEIVEYSEKGPILKRCYVDLVPLNCFWINNDFVFFDQEFYIENYPANLIMWRAIIIVLNDKKELLNKCSKEFLFNRYGFEKYADELGLLANGFISKLRNEKALCAYNDKHRIKYSILNKNMEMAEKKTRNLVETCFDNINDKGIVVIGDGECLNEFIFTYQHDYNVVAIYSGDKKHINFKLGKYIVDDALSINKTDGCKYIVCSDDGDKYVSLLKMMHIDNIGIYSNEFVYPGRKKYTPGKNGLSEYQIFDDEIRTTNDKEYNIGYIAGVFDLFHIGHLNLFKKAKSMCNYLIVGVVSDRGAIEKNRKKIIIPFDERIEIVRACKYVDEAVEIPYEYCQTTHAFRKYNFDVQFSGSDYESDESWLEMREYLRQNGSEMIFLPYTEKRTSTKIKKEIGELNEQN